MRFLLLLVLALGVGCAEAADDPGSPVLQGGGGAGVGGMGAGGVGAGGSDTTATGGGGGQADVCAGHSPGAEPVEMMAVAEDMPTPVGGPIEIGTYHLVAARLYVGPDGTPGGTGKMMQETQVWSLVDLQTVLDYGDGEGERHLELAYDLGAGTGPLATIVICPEQLSVPWKAYSSDQGQLILYAPAKQIAWEYAIAR